ncbi:hypothetical protein [Cryobacterium sp. Hh7]|nr:hypothetical protein [Cryobacterium sp. Hh7]
MTIGASQSDSYYDALDEPAEPVEEADPDDENERRAERERDAWE